MPHCNFFALQWPSALNLCECIRQRDVYNIGGAALVFSFSISLRWVIRATPFYDAFTLFRSTTIFHRVFRLNLFLGYKIA